MYLPIEMKTKEITDVWHYSIGISAYKVNLVIAGVYRNTKQAKNMCFWTWRTSSQKIINFPIR